MITDKDVADKKNDVTMLRLERDEMLIRRQLAKRQSELDDTSPIERSVIGNLRSINTRQHTQIREHCETIGALGSTISELEERDALKTTAIDELQKTIEEMKSKVEPPNLAVMVLLHNLNAKTEALEADLKASHTNNAALGKALEEANTALYNAKNVVEGLEAELSNSKSAIVMKNGVINDRVEHLERVYNQLHGFQDDVYEKNKTIDESNETISDLRMAASDMLDTINECSRRESEDSRMLMQIIEIIKEDGLRTTAWHQIHHIVEDYLAAPESPVVTLKTPSIGTRVVSKNEDTHIIDEDKMKAVRMLVGSDMWVLHTDEEVVEDKQQKETIDELTETTRKLKGRLSSMYAANSDQATTINTLNALLADGKMTLAAYRSNPLSDQVADRDNRIEQLMVLNEALRVDIELAHNLSRDHIAGQDRFIEELRSRMAGARIIIDNQATSIEGLTKDLNLKIKIIGEFKDSVLRSGIEKLKCETTIDELNDMYCDVCGKLERIEKISKKARTFGDVINHVSANHIAIDEITKIIQEE